MENKTSAPISDAPIQANKKGKGTTFLIWGYVNLFVSLAIFIMILRTGNPRFAQWYLLIPALGLSLQFIRSGLSRSKEEPSADIIDYILGKVWKMVVLTFVCSFIVCGVLFVAYHAVALPTFFIVGLIIPAVGCVITGYATHETITLLGGYIGLFTGIAALFSQIVFPEQNVFWHLAYAIAYIIMMIIPGHYLNSK
ncbi:MAG: hypothetical protein Q4F34_08235 [Prevotellaceae bacterium]|nr:hypothetical protein [Prevotellaceae bacterium]